MTPPYYAIAAAVEPGNRLTHFHGYEPDGAVHLLLDIPRFRWAGFDVSIGSSPVAGPDSSWELRSGDRKVLRLYQDGTLVFRARADHDFLGWGTESAHFARFPRLNPVAVTEVNASFVHMYGNVIARLKAAPKVVTFNLSLQNGTIGGQRIYLTRYFPTSMIDWNVVTKYRLQVDPAEAELVVPAADVTTAPNRVAYQLLAAFTSWFDMPEDELPFVAETSEGKEIDIEELRKL